MTTTVKEKAQEGFRMVIESVLDVLRTKDSGETASEIGKALGLHDSRRGGQHGYVIWTALGHLMADGKVQYDSASRRYLPVDQEL